MTERYQGGIERRPLRLSSDEFIETIEQLKKEPFDTFLVSASRFAFAVPLSHGYKYPEEVLELPGRARVHNKRRWRESVVFEMLDNERIEVNYNQSSGLANSTAPIDFHEGLVVSFGIQEDVSSGQKWIRRLTTPHEGLEVFPLKPDLGVKSNMRLAIIEGFVERRHAQARGVAYRKGQKRLLGGRALNL